MSSVETCTVIKPWHIRGGPMDNLVSWVSGMVLGSQQRLGRSLNRNMAHARQITSTGTCSPDGPRTRV